MPTIPTDEATFIGEYTWRLFGVELQRRDLDHPALPEYVKRLHAVIHQQSLVRAQAVQMGHTLHVVNNVHQATADTERGIITLQALVQRLTFVASQARHALAALEAPAPRRRRNPVLTVVPSQRTTDGA